MTTGNDNGFAARRGPPGTRPGGGPVPGYGKYVPAGKRVSAEGNRSGCNGGDDVFLRALVGGFDGPALGHDASLVCAKKVFQGNSAVGGFSACVRRERVEPERVEGALRAFRLRAAFVLVPSVMVKRIDAEAALPLAGSEDRGGGRNGCRLHGWWADVAEPAQEKSVR